MEDDTTRDWTFDKIIHSVFSEIDWGSQQVKSTCPSRERWSWKRVWNWMNKSGKKNEELEKQEESKGVYSGVSQLREKDIPLPVKHNQLSTYGYQYCEIKMQDPCAPCCCAIESIEPPPCTDISRIGRTSRCECTKRKEIKPGYKCCNACGVGLKDEGKNVS